MGPVFSNFLYVTLAFRVGINREVGNVQYWVHITGGCFYWLGA